MSRTTVKTFNEVDNQLGAHKLNRVATGDGNDYTVDDNDVLVAGDTTSSTQTITLPSSETLEGKTYIINDEGGNAGTNNITVATEGSETIDGSSSATISSNYGSLTVYSDGTNWFTR